MAADTLRKNPAIDTERVITELAVGEALISMLDAKGSPTVTERAWLLAPSSQIGPITDAQRAEVSAMEKEEAAIHELIRVDASGFLLEGATSNMFAVLDGALAGTYANFTYKPSDIRSTVNDWLGRSQYNDPYFKGSIDEFRVYDFALPAEEVALNFQLGPDAAPLGPARFLAQAQDQTVGEGQAFALSPDVTGAPPFSFQWFRNSVVLPGATNKTLAGTAALADNGSGDPRTTAERLGLLQVADAGALTGWVEQVLAANAAEVERYRKGETKLLPFFVGQVMKASKGKADPTQVPHLLKERLGG